MSKKVIVLTGGTSGIGVKTISELINNGYFLEFTYNLNIDLAKSIEKEYGYSKVSSYKLDLDSATASSDYAKYLLNKHDEIFGFIHNSGITKIGHLSLLSEADWRLVFNVNIINIFPLLNALSNNMILQKKGSIVFISSVAGVQPAEGQTSYAASKSALIALTRSLGKELGRFNIRVNCISPGFVDTEMVKSLSKKYLDNLRKQIPFNRFAKPIEIAKVINFVISEDASYINCSNIVVDGGLT